ncbi:MAG: hypothetical protein LBJ17_04215 [Dysgonamonadaceae bacterium]|jgi:hypothetical protein|nr:hypothetical protein [Dysgonamonadaceae bacterium]
MKKYSIKIQSVVIGMIVTTISCHAIYDFALERLANIYGRSGVIGLISGLIALVISFVAGLLTIAIAHWLSLKKRKENDVIK